ncbi:MAG TPA: DEAD/DEAH box helicase [Gemmatimonadaceae bacterium]|nr:DEAD/DEAH box helicase [Gemmatimonadaceae bacterium]
MSRTSVSSHGAESPGFADLGLDPRLVDALGALGYEEPTPVQREAIPPLLAGRDLLAQAATGTGKTAAFALPMLQLLAQTRSPGAAPRALILVPTRELAMQVAEAVHRYGKSLGTTVLAVYGGAPMQTQLRALKRGVDVVVATPGRALDHIRRRTLVLDALAIAVLDEADEMLDMGFAEDLDAILDATPESRQTALFSATLPPRIAEIATAHLRSPVRVRIDQEVVAAGAAPRVRQVAYVVARPHKLAALSRVLDAEQPASAIVFCRTRTEVDELTETLVGRGHRAAALHGGLSQEQRDRVMKQFRSRRLDLLVATDVAARGLDVQHVTHVVNYDVPSAAEAYVHRIGRTGRAGREGVAITFAEPREHRLLRNVERVTGQSITISTVPSAADMRARRLELTRSSIVETLEEGDLDTYRVVVETLAGEFDIMDVAAAAIKQLATRDGDASEEEIPTASAPSERTARGAARATSSGRGAREHDTRSRTPSKAGGKGAPARARARVTPEWDVTRLFIGAGRKAGVRPSDVVGAIANEVGIDSRAVGAIQITDRFTLVEVPEEIADDIVAALRASTIKGKRVPVRRDREAG